MMFYTWKKSLTPKSGFIEGKKALIHSPPLESHLQTTAHEGSARLSAPNI